MDERGCLKEGLFLLNFPLEFAALGCKAHLNNSVSERRQTVLVWFWFKACSGEARVAKKSQTQRGSSASKGFIPSSVTDAAAPAGQERQSLEQLLKDNSFHKVTSSRNCFSVYPGIVQPAAKAPERPNIPAAGWGSPFLP